MNADELKESASPLTAPRRIWSGGHKCYSGLMKSGVRIIIVGAWLVACGDERAGYILDDQTGSGLSGGGDGEACMKADDPPDALFQLTDSLSDAEYWQCPPPGPGAGPLDVDGVEGTGAAVSASTARYELDWSGESSVEGDDLLFWFSGAQPARGYFRIPIGPMGSRDPVVDGQPLDLQFRIGQTAASGPITLGFGLASETEAGNNPPIIGKIKQTELHLVHVGGGDIQINLNWNTLTDLDLHVLDPELFEIYFGDEVSPSGGTLDLDSYAACNFTGDPGRGNENVFWPNGAAPSGLYVVAVDMWSDCDTFATGEVTEYAVTVITNGSEVSIHEGTFTSANTTFIENVEVVRFNYP